MLSEAAKRKYSIDPKVIPKLEALCDKILSLVEQWKQRVTQQAVAGGHTSIQLQQELAKYISKQTNHQLFIGTVKGYDHGLGDDRTFRVLLQAGTNVGGYFDDHMTVGFLEDIKHEADRLGIDATAKKYKVKKTVVQYAHETPVKDLRTLRGRGDIVIDLSSVLVSNPMPEVMELLTHELTHGVQTLVPQSARYDVAVGRLHAGEQLSKYHARGYFREKPEFEAQLNGMLANLKYKYKQKGDAEHFKQEMAAKYSPQQIAVMTRGGSLEQTLKTRQQQFKQMLIDRLLNTPREVAMDIAKNGEKISNTITDLKSKAHAVQTQLQKLNDKISAYDEESATEEEMEEMMDVSSEIDRLQEEYSKYRKQGIDLENKYYLLKTSKLDFITSIAGDKRLWDEYHRALNDLIASLN